jgi:hypothetical protein
MKQLRIEPLVDLVVPGYQGAGETGDEQENRAEQPKPAVQKDENGAHRVPFEALI